jgi:hypothetical protein
VALVVDGGCEIISVDVIPLKAIRKFSNINSLRILHTLVLLGDCQSIIKSYRTIIESFSGRLHLGKHDFSVFLPILGFFSKLIVIHFSEVGNIRLVDELDDCFTGLKRHVAIIAPWSHKSFRFGF